MKIIRLPLLWATAAAFLCLSACSEKENSDSGSSDEAYFASKATISCSASEFTATDDGGTVRFIASGGEVRILVDCGVDWIVENSATDLFSTSMNTVTLTVTAEQNTIESERTGTLVLYTANAHIQFAKITVIQDAYGKPRLSIDTAEVTLPAIGELSTEIAVDATEDWEYKYSARWLSVEKTTSGIKLTAAENEETDGRDDEVILLIDDGISTVSQTIAVNQDGLAYISPSLSKVTFYEEAGSLELEIDSNFDWDYSYNSGNGWFTLSRGDNTLTVTVTASDSEREEVITLTAGDGAVNITELQIPVVQHGPQPNALILEYTITKANTTVNLPIAGTLDCTVDWGDYTEIETMTEVNPSHTYTSTGTFTVRVNGTVTALSSKGFSNDSTPDTAITAVKQWGNTGLTEMSYAFYYCKNLTSVAGDTAGAFTGVTSFDFSFQFCGLKELPADLFAYAGKATSFIQTFYNCQSLESLPAGLLDGCINAISFYATFNACITLRTIPKGLFNKCTEALTFNGTLYNCPLLESIPGGLFDNCTKATDFSYVFGKCESLKTIPAGLFANNVNAVTYYCAFYECAGIETIQEKLFANNVNAENFGGVFYECTSLEAIPADLFADCTKAQSFYMSFCYCSSLTAVPAGLFDNCPEAESFYATFYEAKSIETIPAGLFDNCPKVTSFRSTFYNLRYVQTIPAGLFKNCHKVTDSQFLFYNWQSLTEIPEGLFDNFTEITSCRGVFYNCHCITSIPEDLFKYCPEITNFNSTFYNCVSLISIPAGLFDNNKKATDFTATFYVIQEVGGESPYTIVNGEKVHLYERSEANGFVEPTSHNFCFASCYSLDDWDDIPSSWKVESIRNSGYGEETCTDSNILYGWE